MLSLSMDDHNGAHGIHMGDEERVPEVTAVHAKVGVNGVHDALSFAER